MSIITCQIGQCGNQLGKSLYSKLLSEATSSQSSEDHMTQTINTYFTISKNGDLVPNSLMIDMEPKVIEQVLASKGDLFSYDRGLSVCREEGSGNNWAFGFNVHGLACLDEIVDKFRSAAERVDRVEGAVVLQSMAGGTGSGVGSRVIERLRDEMEAKPIFSVAVLPRMTGEVILQYYNSVFSLANLYSVLSPHAAL